MATAKKIVKAKRVNSIIARGTTANLRRFSTQLGKIGYTVEPVLSSENCVVTYTRGESRSFNNNRNNLGNLGANHHVINIDTTANFARAIELAKEVEVVKPAPAIKVGNIIVREGRAERITEITNDIVSFGGTGNNRIGWFNLSSKVKISAPTDKQIAEVNRTVYVGGYRAGYPGGNEVAFGCNRYTKAEVYGLRKVLTVSGGTITIRGTQVTADMLSTIYNNIK